MYELAALITALPHETQSYVWESVVSRSGAAHSDCCNASSFVIATRSVDVEFGQTVRSTSKVSEARSRRL